MLSTPKDSKQRPTSLGSGVGEGRWGWQPIPNLFLIVQCIVLTTRVPGNPQPIQKLFNSSLVQFSGWLFMKSKWQKKGFPQDISSQHPQCQSLVSSLTLLELACSTQKDEESVPAITLQPLSSPLQIQCPETCLHTPVWFLQFEKAWLRGRIGNLTLRHSALRRHTRPAFLKRTSTWDSLQSPHISTWNAVQPTYPTSPFPLISNKEWFVTGKGDLIAVMH